MNVKLIKSVSSGLKQISTGIKSYRTARAPETLALKRLQAKNYADTISDETLDKISKIVFEQKGDSHSVLLDKLQNYKKFCEENGIKMPQNVLEAFTKLEHKAAAFADRMTLAKSKGKTPQNYFNFGQKFQTNNREELCKVQSFIEEQQNAAMEEYHKLVFGENYDAAAIDKARKLADKTMKESPNFSYLYSDDLYNSKIGEIKSGIIQQGQTFYHGTTHQRSISRNGFHLLPKSGQAALGSRELGEGVYLTPDRSVASYYAGTIGGILHLKVDTEKVAVVNNAQIDKLLREIGTTLGVQQVQNPAVMEILIKKLFQRNGFNAVYTKEALGSGIFEQRKLVDALVGGKQSQLVVFDTNDITIRDKTFKERMVNQKLQLETVLKAPARVVKALKDKSS